MTKKKKNYLINLNPLIIFLLSGIINFIFERLATYYLVGTFYYETYVRSIRDSCNSGIAPCDITTWFVEPLSGMIGWLIGLLVIIFYLVKNNVKRKWFIFILGIITQFCLYLIIPYDVKQLISDWMEIPLYYLLAFGIQFLIFNKLLR